MKKQTDRVKKEDERFCIKSEIKFDNRDREEVFEVKSKGVSIDWTSNYTEAAASQRQSLGSQLYSINMQSGRKTLRVA